MEVGVCHCQMLGSFFFLPSLKLTARTWQDGISNRKHSLRESNAQIDIHPRKLTWNLKITHLERKNIWTKPSFWGSMLIFRGVIDSYPTKSNQTFCAARGCTASNSSSPGGTDGDVVVFFFFLSCLIYGGDATMGYEIMKSMLYMLGYTDDYL